MTANTVSLENIEPTDDHNKFVVTTGGDPYEVDLTEGMCTCPNGNTGHPCKHQIACAEINLTTPPQMYQGTPEQKKHLAYVAHGQLIDKEFFSNMEDCLSSSLTDPNMVIEICENEDEIDVSVPKHSSIEEPRVITICDNEAELEHSTKNSSSAETVAVIQSSEDEEGSGDIEELKKIFAHVSETVCKFYCKGMMPIARKFANRVKNIKTTNACTTFLASTGRTLGLGRNRRSKISVQPTAVSRRKVDSSRGRGRCLQGRITKKRAHNLVANVASNLPNAKLH